MGRWVFVGWAGVAACVSDRPQCDAWLDCVAASNPAALEAEVAVHGRSGSCAASEVPAVCEQECALRTSLEYTVAFAPECASDVAPTEVDEAAFADLYARKFCAQYVQCGGACATETTVAAPAGCAFSSASAVACLTGAWTCTAGAGIAAPDPDPACAEVWTCG